MTSPLDARYGGTTGLDTNDHTQRLYDMFTDPTLTPPYNFVIPPCPNGVGWFVHMGPEFKQFPIKSDWTARTERDADGYYKKAATIYRGGPIVQGQLMFGSNRMSTVQNVHIDLKANGRKYWVADTYYNGMDDIDNNCVFVKIATLPTLEQWNRNISIRGRVDQWPGITYDFHQIDGFNSQGTIINWSHRGSLIFRFGHRNVVINNPRILESGDDAIAFNGKETSWEDTHPDFQPEKTENAWVTNAVLSERDAQGIRGDGKPYSGGNDIPSIPGTRYRTGNRSIAIRGGYNINMKNIRVKRTMDGYTDPNGEVHKPVSALDFGPYLGQTAEKITLDGLIVDKVCRSSGLTVKRETTGSVANAQHYGTPKDGCHWKMPTYFGRSNLTPSKVCPA